jgi:hypothetical protein
VETVGYDDFGSSGWVVTPVGKTALEQALARYLSLAVTVESIVFAEPHPLSSSPTTGDGFAPRRGTLTTRSGRGDAERIELFFKIPSEREVEAHVLGRRLGLRHLPRIIVPSLDIQGSDGETKAFCYVYAPGGPLGGGSGGSLFTAESLPEGIVADMAVLHASTAGHSEAYLRRGYTVVSGESLAGEASVAEPAAYLDLPYVRDDAGAAEDLLRRADAVLPHAVDLTVASGPVVVHGELEPRNIVAGDGDEYTLVDWGDMGLGWAALDLAPCLGYDQIPLYRGRVAERNPSWGPPDENALAAARLVHALVHLKRLVRGDGPPPVPDVVKVWIERLEEALTRL